MSTKCRKCKKVKEKMIKRNYILIEKEEKYCEIARDRLRQEVMQF